MPRRQPDPPMPTGVDIVTWIEELAAGMVGPFRLHVMLGFETRAQAEAAKANVERALRGGKPARGDTRVAPPSPKSRPGGSQGPVRGV